jgi:hypothetical protein
MRNKLRHLWLVLLAFVMLAFVSCDQKKPDKGYLTDEEVLKIVEGFSKTTDYVTYTYDGTFQYLGFPDELIPQSIYKKKEFVDSLDKYDSKSVSYYLRMPLHLTKDNWTYYDETTKSANSTKERITAMLLTYGKTLDEVYYYTDAEGSLIIKTFGANKALYIKNPSEVICHGKWNVTLTYNSDGYLVSEVFETINAHKDPDSESCYGQATYSYSTVALK